MDMIHFPSRLIHNRLTWIGLPEYGWCRQVMITASPKSNIFALTSGAGAEPTPLPFCLLRVSMRPAFEITWSLFELICTNSSAICGAQASASCPVTPVSKACHEAMIAASASFAGFDGTVLHGFSQSFTPDPAEVEGCSSCFTS